MSSSVLTEELAHLQDKIEHVRRRRTTLDNELRALEAELEKLSADRERFAAVKDACASLDRVGKLKAEEIFWEGVADPSQAARIVERARSRVARFEEKISAVLEQQSALKQQINRCIDELSALDEEVHEAYAREAWRQAEYVVEREMSPVPSRPAIMPWSTESESERRFRKALLVSLLLAFFAGTLIRLLHVPAPVRPIVAVVPERLVSMLREQPRRAAPPKEEKKPEKAKEEKKAPPEELPKQTAQEPAAVPKKTDGTGVLAFKEKLKDLVQEDPAARLGSHARLGGPSAAGAGESRSGRSLLTMPSTYAPSSGGISSSAVNRTVGRDNEKRIESVSLARVESTVAGPAEEAKPVSSGPGPSRTDEEIQLVFDKYKASLYRMYNAELRKNPTLRGKIILRITIEPGGEVSQCQVQSGDLSSPELVAQIVERVKRFNFGSREKVPATTILYPIDFLPGG